MKIALFAIFSLSFTAYSKESDCARLSVLQSQMDVHASNYVNAETTRTPQGGAYRYKSVICHKKCVLQESSKYIQKYSPSHPDADQNGYVTFPDIDKLAEKSLVSAYAMTLVMAAKACSSSASVMEIKTGERISAFNLKYTAGNVLNDVMNLAPDGGLVSWVRVRRNSSAKIVNF